MQTHPAISPLPSRVPSLPPPGSATGACASALRSTARLRPLPALRVLALLTAGAWAGCGNDSTTTPERVPGQTDFESEVSRRSGGPERGMGGPASATPTGAPGAAQDGARSAAPPSGRTGPVQEADIYRVDQNRLFYLNTYRGFLIYDVNDPKKPRQLSRLPVHGYPVEMFVQGNTVYALLSDVLYMTQAAGKVHFERHNVSQLVVIDITDLANPTILKRVDIVGQLREGVSRKIEDTVYVVSYIPQSYYWGWRYELPSSPEKEQAWVYSFNIAQPANPTLVQKLKIFEGGSIAAHDPVTGGEVTRSFGDVAISATSNALMVVENWHLSSWTPAGKPGSQQPGCGSYIGDQRAVVSMIDISDPAGAIRLHARFETRGTVSDQFKQTYIHDTATNTGTYLGIFARRAWNSADCSGRSFTQNVFESWDVTNGAAPARLSSLAFGKPDETVRGSAFDPARKAAYAITAQNIDPLYVLSFTDRAKLTIRSEIDGLSGDMSLFRLVEGNNFLVGIGRDNSETCKGLQGTETRANLGVAVSLIDVRNLDAIRLVQRQCVAVDGDWVTSQISWNMDQAHKLIGMQFDGTTNVITVPVSYYKRLDDQTNGWWWNSYETAVGIMSWDLAQYDPAKPAAAQTVIKNFGTYVHPNGEVRRSIVFTHQGATPRRMMINLSDTHISIADIQDLARPIAQAVVEVAPYVGQIFPFGQYVVETVSESTQYWAPQQGKTEFRVKRAGAALDDAAIVARFSASQVQSAVPHGNMLVVFRGEQEKILPGSVVSPNSPTAGTQVLVYDLSDPAAPVLAGSTRTTALFYPYARFFCGVGAGYWFDQGQSNFTSTRDAIVFLHNEWVNGGTAPNTTLISVNLADPATPTVSVTPVAARPQGYLSALVPDGVDDRGLFLTYADYVGPIPTNGGAPTRVRNFAQRFHLEGATWVGEQPVNLPGQLVRTWSHSSGSRAYLTSDHINTRFVSPAGDETWRTDTRFNLLRAAVGPDGRPAAELRASHHFVNRYVSDMVLEQNALFVNVNAGYGGYWFGRGVGIADVAGAPPAVDPNDLSDRLVAFDLSRLAFDSVYDQPTGTQGVQLMGTHRGQLFVNVPGDGVLAVDVSDPARPVGRQFLRTLGWTSHIAFVGDNAYVAAGYFGVYHMDLAAPAALAAAR